jgi:hypothetical protein
MRLDGIMTVTDMPWYLVWKSGFAAAAAAAAATAADMPVGGRGTGVVHLSTPQQYGLHSKQPHMQTAQPWPIFWEGHNTLHLLKV